MERRILGKTGLEVSVLGFGGAEIGFEGTDVKTVKELLSAALDAGLNVIDTAECYIASEELIGEAVSARRADFHLFTKCGHQGTYEVAAWEPHQIAASIEKSLKRLRTDHLDLVQLHSCDLKELEKGKVIEALQKAQREGKTRFIGYSGDSDAAVFAVNTGAFDTLQISVNIADQESVERVVPLARERNMGVIAKRPVANAAWKSKSRPEYFYIQPYWERLQELSYDFINGDINKSVSTALKFTLAVPGVHTAIVGTTKPGRWTENAEALAKGPIEKEKYEYIRRRWQEISGAKSWTGQV